MATLGEWHHRPGGRWRVWRSEFVLWKIGPLLIRGYQWTADSDATVTRLDRVKVHPFDEGHVACAWLARARAIAALRRMRRDTDERMASRCGEKEATGGP